ncbi:MAG: NUDIX hydrolase [Eubacteriales bacterium]|nr:NUDIX hydrolase [Eubacteriales bacterium]
MMKDTLRKDFEELAEKKIDSTQVFDGVLLKVYRDNVTLPDGNPSVREVIHLYGAVGIIPITKDGKVVIERQFRYPVNDITIEIPAGKLDGPDEDPLAAAKRELLEETGITAKKWIPMGLYHPSPAYTDEKIILYMAKDLEFGNQKLDEGEFLNVDFLSLKDLVDMVMDGKIIDGKTQLAILKAAYLEKGSTCQID